MHALLSTVLPPSAVHHSLFLPNFTPSTIYPLPRPHDDSPEIRVVGNLIVAGSEDIRVFEIRESTIAIPETPTAPNGADGTALNDVKGGPEEIDGMDEDFYDTGPSEVRLLPYAYYPCSHSSQRAPVRFETTRKLHLLSRHQLHGIITGLAGLRTLDSSVDGLDRLLVSFKDAKVGRNQHDRRYRANVRWQSLNGPEVIWRQFRCTLTSDALKCLEIYKSINRDYARTHCRVWQCCPCQRTRWPYCPCCRSKRSSIFRRTLPGETGCSQLDTSRANI